MPTFIPHARKRVALALKTNGGANQADHSDLNVLVAQYRKTGTFPAVAKANPLYGDFTFPSEIHEMREAVEGAMERFDQLPSDVRTLAENDWVQFIDMYNDPLQREALESAGLIVTDNPPPVPNNSPPPEPSPTPPETPPATDPPTPPAPE